MFGSTFIILVVVAGISSSSIPACYVDDETCEIYEANHTIPNEPFDFTIVREKKKTLPFEFSITSTPPTYPFTYYESLKVHGVMKYVPNNVFIQFSNLKELQISDCSLQQIKRDDFKNAQKLVDLDLSENQLTIIENYTFTGAENIEGLWLEKNNIKVVEQLAFVNLLKLKRVNLRNNSIQHLDSNIFATNLNIQTLRLSFNEFENVDFIQPLVNIETLQVDSNRIANINRNLLDDKTNLESLRLKDNCFSMFDFDILQKIILMDVSDNYLDESSLLKLKNLKKLYLFEFFDNNVNCTIENDIERALGKSQFRDIYDDRKCQEVLTYRPIKNKCKGKVMDMTETLH